MAHWTPFLPLDDYDVEVRRLRPGENVDEHFGGLFEVRFLKRDGRGREVEGRSYLVMEDGYCLALTPWSHESAGKSPQ